MHLKSANRLTDKLPYIVEILQVLGNTSSNVYLSVLLQFKYLYGDGTSRMKLPRQPANKAVLSLLIPFNRFIPDTSKQYPTYQVTKCRNEKQTECCLNEI